VIEVKLTTVSKIGDLDKEELITYNVSKKIAEIIVSDGDDELYLESEERFSKNIKEVRKIANRDVIKLKKKIRNNRIVIEYSENDESELKKAQKHLEHNEYRLQYIIDFLENKLETA
jgi:hypothetical protein